MSALPPYALLLGMSLQEQEGAAPLIVMPPGEAVFGRPGFLHGGAISGLLEVAAFAAIRRAVPVGTGVKPISLTVDFMRGGRLVETRAQARVVRLGGRIANFESIAWQDDPAEPISIARVTMMLRRERTGQGAGPPP